MMSCYLSLLLFYAKACELTQIWKANLNEHYVTYEFRSEQTGSGSKIYIFNDNKIISLTNLFQQYIKNLSEWEIEFLSSYYGEKSSNAYKIRKSGLL